MKSLFWIAASLSLAFAPAAFAQKSPQKGKESHADATAIKHLAEANMAEVEAGKLAQQKAQSDEVKQFAQHMVDDHGKMLDEVKQMAEAKGVKLPGSPDMKHKAVMKKLEGTSQDKFDQAYMKAMVKDHQDTIKELQKMESKAKDPQVKQAVQQALPEIKEHLKMAQSIEAKTGGSSTGSSSKGSSSKESSSGASAGASSKSKK